MIKVAIIGLGWWGSIILKALLNSPVVNPVLGVDPNEPARAAASALGVKTAARFEDALADPEIKAVILCTPQQHHATQIVAAAPPKRTEELTFIFFAEHHCSRLQVSTVNIVARTASDIRL